HPRDPAPLVELDHVIVPDTARGERHREHIAGAPDSLPGGCAGQVIVAVPAWLLRRIRDQLEDQPRSGRDLPAGTHHVRRNRLSPPAVTISRMRASPAWAPRASPTSWDSEQGVHSRVENA